ncbi:hypothetical protein [Flavobacterium sp.]|uniref:hypothetical protein n=1 Tax=Flavobacterium sp. TaxID=239 RepID=UPI00260CB66D|nr:hypothetical protein [Flavobacterium sp.]
MNKSYAVDPDQLQALVAREVNKKMLLIYVIFGLFALLFPVLTHFAAISFLPTILFALIGLLCYASIKNGTQNLAAALQITFTDNAVIKTHNKGDLDGLTKASMELNSMRHGQKFDCVIPFRKISNLEIDENGIKIYSTDADIFNDNGTIKIPKEIMDYSEILTYVKANPEIYKMQNY